MNLTSSSGSGPRGPGQKKLKNKELKRASLTRSQAWDIMGPNKGE